MTDQTDFSCTIEELEGRAWEKPESNATWMVKSIHALRKKPLGSLSDGEVRLAVSQSVGIPFILDLAFQRLEADPLLEGDYYPGDILSALIRAEASIWVKRPALHARLGALYERAMAQPPEMVEAFRESLGLPSNSPN